MKYKPNASEKRRVRLEKMNADAHEKGLVEINRQLSNTSVYERPRTLKSEIAVFTDATVKSLNLLDERRRAEAGRKRRQEAAAKVEARKRAEALKPKQPKVRAMTESGDTTQK